MLIKLKEGYCRKQGVNDGPKTPKPNIKIPSQMPPARQEHQNIIRVKRTVFTEKSTIGELYMPDGAFQCFTLEDTVRDHKIPGQTAIPAGTYELVVTFSPRYQKPMPRLLDVPFYQGILIHNGNTPEHSEGCLLVGRKKGVDCIQESILAFEELLPKIRKLIEKGELFVQIEGGVPADKWRQA